MRYNRFKYLWDDFKVEAIILSIFLIYNAIKSKINIDLSFLQCYFTPERLDMLVSFCSITIGIYMAVLSIFATTITIASKKIVENKLDKKFVRIIFVGLIENILVAVFAMAIPDTFPHFIQILCLLLILALYSFQKFIWIVIKLFRINIENVANTVEEQENYKEDILYLLEQIDKNHKK